MIIKLLNFADYFYIFFSKIHIIEITYKHKNIKQNRAKIKYK